jgi:NAD(P)-dependent dehydrogenase (short-subunit alcohol dehydrogenase family)
VSRIFITGSADGLGRAAAGVLMGEGHDPAFQDQLMDRLAALTGIALF